MEKLISTTNNASGTLDKHLFEEFMKKNPVCDYANISRQSYLSFSHDAKKKIIRQYYFHMKDRSSGKFRPF